MVYEMALIVLAEIVARRYKFVESQYMHELLMFSLDDLSLTTEFHLKQKHNATEQTTETSFIEQNY